LSSRTVPPADSGSLTRFVSIRCNCLGLGRVATGYVGVFPFCRPLHACVRRCFLAVFDAYRKMKYGQFTDVQRPSFGFRYSFGESHGFSGSEETQLISDPIIAQDLGSRGALLPESWRLYENITQFHSIALALGMATARAYIGRCAEFGDQLMPLFFRNPQLRQPLHNLHRLQTHTDHLLDQRQNIPFVISVVGIVQISAATALGEAMLQQPL